MPLPIQLILERTEWEMRQNTHYWLSWVVTPTDMMPVNWPITRLSIHPNHSNLWDNGSHSLMITRQRAKKTSRLIKLHKLFTAHHRSVPILRSHNHFQQNTQHQFRPKWRNQPLFHQHLLLRLCKEERRRKRGNCNPRATIFGIDINTWSRNKFMICTSVTNNTYLGCLS